MAWFGIGSEKNSLYETLVRAYAPELFRFAYWLCRDRHVSKELVQETCLRAWKNWHSLNDPQLAKQWLFTILRREEDAMLARVSRARRMMREMLDEQPNIRRVMK